MYENRSLAASRMLAYAWAYFLIISSLISVQRPISSSSKSLFLPFLLVIVEVTIARQRHWKTSIEFVEMSVSDQPVIEVGVLMVRMDLETNASNAIGLHPNFPPII